MLLHTGRIRERIYFGHYELVNIFVSRLVFSFILAYFVHIFIELPFASIEEYIFPSKRRAQVVKPVNKSTVKVPTVHGPQMVQNHSRVRCHLCAHQQQCQA